MEQMLCLEKKKNKPDPDFEVASETVSIYAGSGGATSCSIARPSYTGDTLYLSKHHTAPALFEGAACSCGAAASPAADIPGSPSTDPATAAHRIGFRIAW